MSAIESEPAASPAPIPADAATPGAETRRGRRHRPKRGLGIVLLWIGSALTLAALGVLAVTVIGLATIQSEVLARISEQNLDYRAEFGFVERQLSALSAMTAVPGIILVAATAFLIPGYLTLRGTMHGVPSTFMRGGSNVAIYRPLALWAHALWCLLPLAIWVALVVVPLRSMMSDGWPAGLRPDNLDAVWMLLAIYGGVASALVGVLVTSLLKKAFYLRVIARNPDAAAGSSGRGVWRWITFRWRFDLWLAGIGAGFVGLCWIALGFDDPEFFRGALLIGVVLMLGGMILSLNYWRAGEPLGAAESYS